MTLWETVQPFVSAGVAASVVAAIFRLMVPKWVDSQFNIRLENRKHIQQKEIEELRHTIQRMFSRVSKIHEKEFEVLPKAWFMFHDAQGEAYNVTCSLRTNRPPFESMSPSQFDEFLAETSFSQLQRDELRASTDRPKDYRKFMDAIGLQQALKKQRLFNNYLVENRIFMTEALRNKFSSVSTTLLQGLTDYEHGRWGDDYKLRREGEEKVRNLQSEMPELEKLLQDRLHFDEA